MKAPLMSPQAAAFELPGTRAACLLIHGFTGTPDEMRPLGERLYQRGFHVLAPLLPGHGTTPENMARTTKNDWIATLYDALGALRGTGLPLFIAGLSMGGILTLRMAAELGNQIKALAVLAGLARLSGFQGRCLAPILRTIPYYDRIKPFYSKNSGNEGPRPIEHIGYRKMPTRCIFSLYDLLKETRRLLPNVTIPTLLIYSKLDPTVPPSNMRYISRRLGSSDQEKLLLENSGHILTKDVEQGLVLERVAGFFERRLGRV